MLVQIYLTATRMHTYRTAQPGLLSEPIRRLSLRLVQLSCDALEWLINVRLNNIVDL